MRCGVPLAGWAVVVLMSWPSRADAEWQIRPALSFNVGQQTTLGVGQPSGSVGKFGLGASGALIGEVLGVELDFGRRTGFFPAAKESGAGIIKSSSVTTLTGNVTVALPRHVVEYTLRPYFVAGGGLMAVRIDHQQVDAFDVSLNMKTTDVGGGVTGFLTKRIGLNWDVRHFHSFGGGPELSLLRSTGSPELSFWRANMALAIRY